jgi:antitoxin component YwqK of YwqJK toxin-antitoxin module
MVSKILKNGHDNEHFNRNGKYKEHNRHGILVREGDYRNGLRSGTWKIYNELTGQLVIEEEYKDGVLHGKYRSFYEDGSVFSVGNYYRNKREGEFRVFDRNQQHIMTMRFHDDVLLEVTEYKKSAATLDIN